MKRLTPLVLTALFTGAAAGQSAPEPGMSVLFEEAFTEDLSQFQWKKRPVIVFADSENDPAFVEQLELLHASERDLLERDVIVLTDTDPDARNPLRLKMRPRGFMLVLVGKDGGIKQRKPFPWSVREITRSIDKMPMRQREIRDEKERARAANQ